MGVEDRVREAIEAVPDPGLRLIGGYYIPTVPEGDPHDRITRLEHTVLALLAGIDTLAKEVNDLSMRLDGER